MSNRCRPTDTFDLSRWILGAAIAMTTLIAGYYMVTRPYGEISDRGYQYAAALFSTCNQRDDERLREISQMLADSLQEGDVRSKEAQWLFSIIDDGLAGDWEAASRDVRRLMEDQLERAAAMPIAE